MLLFARLSRAFRQPAVCRGGRRLGLLAALFAIAVACQDSPLAAQVGVGKGIIAFNSYSNEPITAFLAPQPSVRTLETLEEFRGAVEKQAWEDAFRLLDQLFADSSVALVPDHDGFKLPLRSSISRALAQLPPAGKTAYRVFYDAQAKALWERVQHEQGPKESEQLSRLTTGELIASVGDLAANRLGDVLFEQGDLDGAINAWQSVLNKRPDSKLRPVDLLVKTATAMARAGRSQELAEVVRQIERRHAGESVVVGGRKISAAELGVRLVAEQSAPKDEPLDDVAPDFLLPEKDEPAWQLRFLEPLAQQQPQQIVVQMGGRGMVVQGQLSQLIVPTAVAGGCLYGTLLGCDFALDLETGKLLWSSRRFHDVAKLLQQRGSIAADRMGLAAAGDQLWSTTQVLPQVAGTNRGQWIVLQQGMGSLLTRRDLKSGAELLTSANLEALKPWEFTGAPLLAGGNVYLCARKKNQSNDLYVAAVCAADGRLLWSTPIGTYQFARNQNILYGPKPTLSLRGTRLYVDTNVGGIAELEAATGAVRWEYLKESKAPGRPQVQRVPTGTMQFNPCGPLVRGGMLYINSPQSPEFCAIRLDRPAVAWTLSLPQGLAPVAIDNERIYLAGNQVSAYNLKTQKLAWESRLLAPTAWIQPLLTRSRYYQLTSRGVYEINKTSGKLMHVFRGSDPDATGGAIAVTPKLLITISNRAITAYPLGKAATEAAAAEQPGRDRAANLLTQ